MYFPKNPNLLGKFFISEKRARWYGENSQDRGESSPFQMAVLLVVFNVYDFFDPKKFEEISHFDDHIVSIFQIFFETTNITR